VLSLAWTPLPGLVLPVLAAELLLRELDGGVAPALVVAYAAGLLLLTELVAWADALRPPALVAPGVVARRTGSLAGATLAGAAAAAAVLGAATPAAPNAFAAGVAGAVAVAALVALLLRLGRAPG
jgi:hypothetical protein